MASPDLMNSNPYEAKIEEKDKQPQQQETTEEALTEDEAKKMVEDFLNSQDTPGALMALWELEKNYGKLPERMKEIYKKAKEDAINQLKNDSNFQLALEQVWITLDEPMPLSEIWEEGAGRIAGEIVDSPATKQQLQIAETVIEKYNNLDPKQKEALEKGLQDFRNSILSVATDLGISK